MKEFNPILEKGDKVKIANERKVEYEKKLLGTTQRHKGHTMWEINCGTGTIVPAEYDEERIEFVPNIDLITGEQRGTTPKAIRDIICKENCVYISSLNKKTAVKKYLLFLIDKKKATNETQRPKKTT